MESSPNHRNFRLPARNFRPLFDTVHLAVRHRHNSRNFRHSGESYGLQDNEAKSYGSGSRNFRHAPEHHATAAQLLLSDPPTAVTFAKRVTPRLKLRRAGRKIRQRFRKLRQRNRNFRDPRDPGLVTARPPPAEVRGLRPDLYLRSVTFGVWLAGAESYGARL